MSEAIFNPALFKLVREQNSLSQKDLAVKLGVQQSSVCKFEAGGMIPSEAVISKMSSSFGYLNEFFFQKELSVHSGLIFHRKRAALGAKERIKLEAEARLRAMDVLYLFRKKGLQSNVIPRENRSPEVMAQDLRVYWNVKAGPIENLTELLESNRIVIISFDFGTSELDGFVINVDNIVCIAMNKDDCFSPDRRRFTLCHELAHALLHQNEFPSKDAEKEADKFAAEFLAPENCIKDELTPPLTMEKLKTLKSQWKMSMASLIYRAHALGNISDAVYHRLLVFMSTYGFRKHEPECGLVFETPSLLNSMMREFYTETLDAPAQLGLSLQRFTNRYLQTQEG